VRVSLGLAELGQEDGREPSALIREADQALYQAKSMGGNTTVVYRSSRRAA